MVVPSGGVVDYGIGVVQHWEPDVLVRPGWANAALALQQIDKGRAVGRRSALWLRARLQARLFHLGCFIHNHAGKVLFVALLVLATFCVGLKSASLHSRVEELWVQEGGRLERELEYTQSSLGEADTTTHQLLIQTPKDPGASILHPSGLLNHLQVLQAAASVTVHLYDITWRLKDLCLSPSIPNFEENFIEQIFDNIIPCAIATPLDCFWEGSKLLGPEYPVHIQDIGMNLKWTSLNPQKLIEKIKPLYMNPYIIDTLEDYMKRSGITTGYQEKPCLNPHDPKCPDTAPNKLSGQPPDVGEALSGGCYGFAAKYMHWPEEMLVGGAIRDKTGHVRKASALQSVVQLMGQRELFEFWSGTYKVHHVDWSQEKAELILDSWQRRFSEEVNKQMQELNSTSPYQMHAFSTSLLNSLLGRFSKINPMKLALGYIIMFSYAALCLTRWSDPLRSQAGVGLAGVALISLAVAAGLGFCALLGLPFNASTTQIVPFLALGLGVSDLFLLTAAYAEHAVAERRPGPEQTGTVLMRAGCSVLLSTLSNVAAFFAAALIPIPALRVFSLQAAILLLFNLGAMLLVFPAIVSLDLRRRRWRRCDILCCVDAEVALLNTSCITNMERKFDGEPPKKLQAITRALPPHHEQTVTVLANSEGPTATPSLSSLRSSRMSPHGNNIDVEAGFSSDGPSCKVWSLSRFMTEVYAPWLLQPSVKLLCMVCLIVAVGGGVWTTARLRDGLELTDLVPHGTDAHAFLSAQAKYFGFYNMYAVTEGDFEYPTNQKLLYEYHEAFVRVPSIVKNDDGGLPQFWLAMFRDWLLGLQRAFDQDWSRGAITVERWYPNASVDGVLAYKLLVQTGHVDNPIDKSRVSEVQLVSHDGIINPKAFYNYLSAWASNDVFAYGASQANLRPEPRQWTHAPDDVELKIPKSAPLVYAQLPFYLRGLSDTESVTRAIGHVRTVCKRFEERGLPNYPSGIPFLFWEQYLELRYALMIALACALGGVFALFSVLLVSFWAAALVVFALATLALQILALMTILGAGLSAITAVLLVAGIGVGVRFSALVCLGFVTSVGSRDRRVTLALEQSAAPLIRGACATFLGILMLAFSEFDFIVRYFFYVLVAAVLIGLFNGLVFFPVLLSLIGPSAELVPLNNPGRMSTPSPPPSPTRAPPVRVSRVMAPTSSSTRSKRHHHHHQTGGGGPGAAAEPSLTTITEEGNSWHSTHEIVVQPELVVETTTYADPSPNNQSSSSERSSMSSTPPPSGGEGTHSTRTSGGNSSSNMISNSHVRTKVTATAHVKVEVHTAGGEPRSSRSSRHRSDSSGIDSGSSS